MSLYIRRPVNPEMVEAVQVQPGSHAYPGQGVRPPKPGEWIVQNHVTGNTAVLTNEEFQSQYELAPIPSHLLAPEPGQESEPLPPQKSVQPEAAPPVEQADGGGAFEPFMAAGPSTPMNEAVPGRPAPTPDVQPRQPQDPAPIETVTGQIGPQEELQPAGPMSTEPLEPPPSEA